MIQLIRSVLHGPGRRWSTMSLLSLTGIAVLVGTLYAGVPSSAVEPGNTRQALAPATSAETTPSAPQLEELSRRVDRVSRAWAGAESYYEQKVAPIERVLRRYRDDPELTRHVAVALVREANRVGLEPRLLLAVLLVENPWLEPEIRSSVGAVGLMQVMPLHRGAWSPCGEDLEDIDDNICHGARIFAHYFNASGGNIERALLRYNGCVNGTNTPNCHQYPYHVFARAGRASVLAWLDVGGRAASP